LVAIAGVGAVVAARFSSHVEHGLQQSHAGGGAGALARAASATLQVHVPAGFSAASHQHVHAVLQSASVSAFHLSMVLAAGLALVAGALSLIGITNRPAASPTRAETQS
jgi:hypothetical protein